MSDEKEIVEFIYEAAAKGCSAKPGKCPHCEKDIFINTRAAFERNKVNASNQSGRGENDVLQVSRRINHRSGKNVAGVGKGLGS